LNGPARETSDFVRELSRDLSPVERIARLRTAFARVIGAWLLVAAATVAWTGLSAPVSDPSRLLGGLGVVLSGLVLVGVGGVAASLAMGVPGREPTARGGWGLVAAGVLVAVGVSAWLAAGRWQPEDALLLRTDMGCVSVACGVALLPAVGALLYLARAAPHRAGPAVAGVALGTVALGAATALLGCPDATWRHLLMGHALAPAFGVVVLGLPLFALLRRLRRR
jgi:hypothetical protein